MFRMDEYLERWASKYKLLSHQPEAGSKGKRFYRIDAITSLKPFLENLPNAHSPSLAYVTQVDNVLGGQSEKFLLKAHKVFVLVRQDTLVGPDEEISATDAKLLGEEIGNDLLNYITDDKKNKGNKDLEGIDFKGASVFTTPQKFNGWWPTEVVFHQLIPRNLCVNPEKYHDL